MSNTAHDTTRHDTTARHLAVVKQSSACTMWDDKQALTEIKKIFAPKLTELEFKVFCEMGKATNLNPFLKEIWSVKYDERAPAQIFVGRDGYRKSAQAHPLYDYHTVESIYSNDTFTVENGVIHHKYTMLDRGSLLGAYCIVQRKGSSHPTYVVVDLKEYSTGKSLWAPTGKPATMIKKVAEAQALRAAFQELFSGTYHESEDYTQDIVARKPTVVSERVDSLLADKACAHEPVIYSGEPVEPVAENPETNEPISDEQLDYISGLLAETPLDADRMTKALRYFEVPNIEAMTQGQAERFIKLLSKIPECEPK